MLRLFGLIWKKNDIYSWSWSENKITFPLFLILCSLNSSNLCSSWLFTFLAKLQIFWYIICLYCFKILTFGAWNQVCGYLPFSRATLKSTHVQKNTFKIHFCQTTCISFHLGIFWNKKRKQCKWEVPFSILPPAHRFNV